MTHHVSRFALLAVLAAALCHSSALVTKRAHAALPGSALAVVQDGKVRPAPLPREAPQTRRRQAPLPEHDLAALALALGLLCQIAAGLPATSRTRAHLLGAVDQLRGALREDLRASPGVPGASPG